MTAAPAPRTRSSTARQIVRELFPRLRPQRPRTLREWAEQEVVLPPGGPRAGRKFNAKWQPVSGLILDALGDPRWNRSALTGPVQSGKSLIGFVIPTLYHLCERRERVIVGLPDLDMAADKWNLDILPVLQESKYAKFIPDKGPGSRGAARVVSVKINGVPLRFMSAGGGDKSRSGYTAPVVVMTEVDGYDKAGGQSDETDKVSQMEARAKSFGPRKRIYMECTVTTHEGRIWTEISEGTASRFFIPCPHCHVALAPERDHLQGWKEAENVIQARLDSGIVCPSCSVMWTESDRCAALSRVVLAHRGEDVVSVEDGRLAVTGQPDATDTLGLRYNAALNMIVPLSETAAEEWRASRKPDAELPERGLCQYHWSTPIKVGAVDVTELNEEQVSKRTISTPMGIVPAGASVVTVGIDIGKRLCHWIAVAWRPEGSPHVLQYGRMETAWDSVGVERAILAALREWREQYGDSGWQRDGGAEKIRPAMVWVDAQYQTDVIHAFCSESGDRYLAAQGVGATQRSRGGLTRYRKPRKASALVRVIGEEYHVVRLQRPRRLLVQVNSDHWKSYIHDRLHAPAGGPGGLTLHRGEGNDHLALAKHLVAERQQTERTKYGPVTRWVNPTGRNNHLLDALYLACAAGHMAGIRALEDRAADPEARGAGVPPQLAAPGESVSLTDWFAGMRRRKRRRS